VWAVNLAAADIRALVPHAGNMCLLERIDSATDREVVCSTLSHVAQANPLRRNGRLAALHLAEYGAQAVAVHGGLIASPRRARAGLLVAIRNLELQVDFLDDVAGPLTVCASRLLAGDDGSVYTFVATASGATLGQGRVSILHL
jgi:predicted hotdog family 3-hydroxylacyl-ACP dehydratase